MEDERVQIEDSRMDVMDALGRQMTNLIRIPPLPSTHERFSNKIWYAILD